MEASFDRFGRSIPSTTILVSPNVVLSVSESKVQLGAGVKKKIKKPQSYFLKNAGFAPRFIKGVPLKNAEESKHSIGDKVTVSIFEAGDIVKVTGTTKGRGFAGGVKRWGFAGGPKTHGQSDRHRAPGSIGQTTTPGRVFRGKKMAGHMGSAQLTITGLEVIEVDEKNSLLKVKGSIPGAKNGFLVIEKTGKSKGYTMPPEPKEKEEESQEAKSIVGKEDKEGASQSDVKGKPLNQEAVKHVNSSANNADKAKPEGQNAKDQN